MKHCPECNKNYADPTISFCLADGAPLIFGPAVEEQPTAILSGDDPSESTTRFIDVHETAPTEAHIYNAPKTAASGKNRVLFVVAGLIVAAAIVAAAVWGYRYYGGTNHVESIAVMPFANATGNPDLEYLSDGITESIINALSQLPKLSVKGRSSVFRYKGKDVEPQQVGSDLKVQAVLNGRVLQRGDSMTIRLDLVDAATGNQIWGDQYDRKVTDLAALQNEISRDIAQKLSARLSGADQARIVKDQTQNSEAYQLYLQGRYFWNKRTPPATKTAIEFFQQAIEKDPNYALAYVGLAESYVVADMPLGEAHDRSTAAAKKALEIDPSLGEPHATIANYKNVYDHDYAAAEQEFKRAIELNPNYATAYHWYGEFLVFQGRFDEGFAQYKKALELDPFSLAIGTDYGIGLAFARRFDESIGHLNKLAEMDPSYVRTHEYLADAYAMAGRYEDSLKEREKQLNLIGLDPATIAKEKTVLLDGLHTGGPKGYLSAIITLMDEQTKKGHPPPDSVYARVYAQLGEPDKAFEYLNRSLDKKEDSFIDIKVAPDWDKLRDDPRFINALRKLNFTS